MRLFLLLIAAFALWPTVARADDNRPLSASIEAEGGDAYRATWKIPANIEARHLPALSAKDCAVSGRQRTWSDPLGHWREEVWRCDGGIAGKPVTIAYPFANPNLASIIRYHPGADADPQTVLLQPHETRFSLARPGDERGSFLDFLVLGVEHIWIGVDHLLFVAGLIFIARTPRRVLSTITGFTIAHSTTLVVSTLDLVRLPISAVEAVIALSIVFLAVEVVKGPRDTLTWRKPILVASAFGLLHGFGFAAVLREIGLPEHGFVAALLAFNIGIEIGQVIFAAAMLGLLALLRFAGERIAAPFSAAKLAGYAVGTLASFWMFERMLV
ncbi:HupE/UreJ family protein [Altericroceibacterium xinjiangense]|uniref:HupE/UreJ family protein n=1 Tax=Altericroceibacterium xinjiangense TaxID=762261 RepID=UPI001F49D66D|nr:HupE/UreJ family protein [Altericroceibacterium xinjiangense]